MIDVCIRILVSAEKLLALSAFPKLIPTSAPKTGFWLIMPNAILDIEIGKSPTSLELVSALEIKENN